MTSMTAEFLVVCLREFKRNKITFERTRSLSNALYSSPSKHAYRYIRTHPVTVTGSRPLMGHCEYESVVLLPLKLCVKFEWSIVKHCENI